MSGLNCSTAGSFRQQQPNQSAANQKYFLAMGVLWWICAVPFGIYSLAY